MRTFLGSLLAFLFLLLALATVGSACTITIGPYDDTGRTAPPKTSVLPDPQGGPADEPALDEVQQARLEETARYTRNVVYKGGEILHSIQLPSGDVVDFIQRDTLPGLLYEPPKLDLPQGMGFGLTELEQLPELAELLTDAVPYLRPTFWPYILGDAPDATSIEDYLARYQVGGYGDGDEAEGGQVSGVNRLYAGLDSVVPNRGVFGYMNQFRPKVDDFGISLLELAVFCPLEKPTEVIGIVISVDKKNKFGTDQQLLPDEEPRLHIEYAHSENGKVRYRWDETDGKFVANPFRVHHPGQKVPVSVVGGAQEEHLMAIVQSSTGDWWILYKGDVLGYYPANLFTMLNGGACGVAWYGEVFTDEKGTTPETEMGSGKFPEAGTPNVAYVRHPLYYNLSWMPEEPLDDYHAQPFEPLCYGRAPLTDGLLGLGGPGGFNPACKWP